MNKKSNWEKTGCLLIVGIFLSLIFLLAQSPKFYYMEDGTCFTVWKKLGDNCCITPYK